MKKHKPECASNISCAVYHMDGGCPGLHGCDCKEGGLDNKLKKENVCEKNCPDFKGMELLHKVECDCSCHGREPIRYTKEQVLELIGEDLDKDNFGGKTQRAKVAGFNERGEDIRDRLK